MSGNQTNCSMRLLWKQLHCTLPSLFLLQFTFISFVVSLSWDLFTPKIHNDMKWLQGKLQWSKLLRLNSTWAGWQRHLQRSLSSRQRPVLEGRAHHWFQQPITLVATSPITKKHSVKQPIGTHALWNDLWLAKKGPSRSEYRAKERCRNLVFIQTGWITKCWKVIMELLPDDTKNKLPTSALSLLNNKHIP